MTIKHLDTAIIEDLKEVMEDEFSTLVSTYLGDSKNRLVEIKAAIASGIAKQIREAAHTLKGSSSNIGAVHLSELCKKLEDMGRNNQMDGADVLFDAIEAERLIVEKILTDVLD